MTLIKHMLTGNDNSTYEIVRVGMFASLLIVCVGCAWGLAIAPVIELDKLGELMKNFSVSVANILGWGGIGCAAKSLSEPAA